MMNCKDEDVCPSCFLRRKKKGCGYEPVGYGPDMDGEYDICCEGMVSHCSITDANLMDSLLYYCGIGDPIPKDLLFPILIWSGFNWLNDLFSWEWYVTDGLQDCVK